jgi:hypothetical protein
MAKKIFAILVVASVLGVLVGGCSGEKKDDTTTPPAAGGTATGK